MPFKNHGYVAAGIKASARLVSGFPPENKAFELIQSQEY